MNKASIKGQIVLTGTLKTMSPLLIAAGGQNHAVADDVDIAILRNKDGIAYIPATSLAGVLYHFAQDAGEAKVVAGLFGTEANMQDSWQSSFIFRDVELPGAQVVVRDGIAMDAYTGVTVPQKKYNFQLVERGASGNFYLQMTLRQCHFDSEGELKPELEQLLDQLITILVKGFEIGAGTAKGLGRVKIENLCQDFYDFRNKKDVMAWLSPKGPASALSHKEIAPDDRETVYLPQDCVVECKFRVDGSLLVRDYDLQKCGKEAKSLQDSDSTLSISAVPMTSRDKYVLPGSSIKGALRSHALYILDKLGKSHSLVDNLMGPSPEYMEAHKEEPNSKWKSRLMVEEAYIAPSSVVKDVQVRNSIDRFTGGTIQSRLFATQALYGQKKQADSFSLKLSIKNAQSHEAGLLLFLLRDIQLGRLRFGGEKSIGRGTLEAEALSMHYQGKVYNIDSSLKPQEAEDMELLALELVYYGEE